MVDEVSKKVDEVKVKMDEIHADVKSIVRPVLDEKVKPTVDKAMNVKRFGMYFIGAVVIAVVVFVLI